VLRSKFLWSISIGCAPFNIKSVVYFLAISYLLEEYETLNGFFIGLFGNIPPKGIVSEVKFKHLNIQAVEVTDKRIEKAIISIQNKKS
jgi:putative hemolysin